MPTFDDKKQEKKVKELYRSEEEELARILSKKYQVGYIDLSRAAIDTDALRLIKEDDARRAEVAAFHKVGKKLSVAVRSPNNQRVKDIVAELEKRGFQTSQYMVSGVSLERAWERYKDLSFATKTEEGVLDISNEEIQNLLTEITSLEDVSVQVKEVLSMKKIYRISRILETVLAGSFATDASDVHIEPEESYVRMRYRIDGVLVEILTFDRDTYKLLLSRIKLLSGLKLNVKNRAQDGRFSVKIKESDMEIRTSILPGAYGESIVLRILDPNTIGLSMDELGMDEKLLKIVLKGLARPHGMLLNTGPTGSGKTTALYAFLKKIHKPGVKIITIEDPIEYHLPGIVQTQTNKKYTFALGLRSALRQDPDIIMVGEIRDKEVATTAINAALTGHLVFSTLHTNNAAGAFPRLIDLGVNPKVIGSAINIVMAQRLVRKLCNACKKTAAFEGTVKKEIEGILSNIEDRSLVPDEPYTIYEAVGCKECNNTGYKGRIGIFEAIIVDVHIEKLIIKSPSEREIAAASRLQKIPTMQEDGILKVLRGITSLSELERVTGVDADQELSSE